MSTIVVLGMHRSGTSLLARILHRHGVSMGQNLLEADTYNAGGYFEDQGFLWLNKGILSAAGGSWKVPPHRTRIKGIISKFEKTMVKTIEGREEACQNGIWGWKDPRTCLTVEHYHPKLIEPKYIIVTRNKKDIMNSLVRLHGNSANWDEVVTTYEYRIWKFCSDFHVKYCIVSYENLINRDKFKGELLLLADFLEVKKKDRFLPAINFIRFKNDLT